VASFTEAPRWGRLGGPILGVDPAHRRRRQRIGLGLGEVRRVGDQRADLVGQGRLDLRGQDAGRPELGFWEVETASLRDFPQQFRTFEIVRRSDDTVAIFTTDVDPAVEDGSRAATSRTYAVAAQQIFDNPVGLPPTGSYNAELIVALTADMQAKLKRPQA